MSLLAGVVSHFVAALAHALSRTDTNATVTAAAVAAATAAPTSTPTSADEAVASAPAAPAQSPPGVRANEPLPHEAAAASAAARARLRAAASARAFGVSVLTGASATPAAMLRAAAVGALPVEALGALTASAKGSTGVLPPGVLRLRARLRHAAWVGTAAATAAAAGGGGDAAAPRHAAVDVPVTCGPTPGGAHGVGCARGSSAHQSAAALAATDALASGSELAALARNALLLRPAQRAAATDWLQGGALVRLPVGARVVANGAHAGSHTGSHAAPDLKEPRAALGGGVATVEPLARAGGKAVGGGKGARNGRGRHAGGAISGGVAGSQRPPPLLELKPLAVASADAERDDDIAMATDADGAAAAAAAAAAGGGARGADASATPRALLVHERRNELGWSALFHAAHGSAAVIRYLLAVEGADVRSRAAPAATAATSLHVAARCGPDVVTELVLAGADVNAQCDGVPTQPPADPLVAQFYKLYAGCAPAHLAALTGRAGSLAVLLRAGADLGLRNDAGHTAVQVAVLHDHADALRVALRVAAAAADRWSEETGTELSARRTAGAPSADDAAPPALALGQRRSARASAQRAVLRPLSAQAVRSIERALAAAEADLEAGRLTARGEQLRAAVDGADGGGGGGGANATRLSNDELAFSARDNHPRAAPRPRERADAGARESAGALAAAGGRLVLPANGADEALSVPKAGMSGQRPDDNASLRHAAERAPARRTCWLCGCRSARHARDAAPILPADGAESPPHGVRSQLAA